MRLLEFCFTNNRHPYGEYRMWRIVDARNSFVSGICAWRTRAGKIVHTTVDLGGFTPTRACYRVIPPGTLSRFLRDRVYQEAVACYGYTFNGENYAKEI